MHAHPCSPAEGPCACPCSPARGSYAHPCSPVGGLPELDGAEQGGTGGRSENRIGVTDSPSTTCAWGEEEKERSGPG
jgi:hypothetical protein